MVIVGPHYHSYELPPSHRCSAGQYPRLSALHLMFNIKVKVNRWEKKNWANKRQHRKTLSTSFFSVQAANTVLIQDQTLWNDWKPSMHHDSFWPSTVLINSFRFYRLQPSITNMISSNGQQTAKIMLDIHGTSSFLLHLVWHQHHIWPTGWTWVFSLGGLEFLAQGSITQWSLPIKHITSLLKC